MAYKPLDLSKFKKTMEKAGIPCGWYDPEIWLDTGNYALNKLLSNDYFKGIPLGKVTVFAGESGSGKSYVVSGNLVRESQKRDIAVVMLDSEYAIDRSWVTALGVDASKVDRYSVSTIDDCAKVVSEFMDMYTQANAGVPRPERQPVLFIIDSLGMLNTPTENEQFLKGDMKGDMGRKAKQLKAFVTQCLKLFGPHDIGLVVTNHTYKSQDMFNPDDVISGGSGFVYASSMIVSLNKLKLKVNEDGVKTSEVHGIRSKMKVVKTRYNKPFEEVEVEIPYDRGMDRFSGLVDLFLKAKVMEKDGNYIKWTAKDGTVFKKYEKEWKRASSHEVLMRAMIEHQETAGAVSEAEACDLAPSPEDEI